MADLDTDLIRKNPPPFWQLFSFFLSYLKQEKLYYQITLLALANFLLIIPVILVTLIITALLFLASYKLAFEVLHTVSSGQFDYKDSRTDEISDMIGFKAIFMGVIQLLIYIFIYRQEPPIGMALLVLTTVITPAYLMMLSKTQSVVTSLNPLNLMTLMSRIGSEYAYLVAFFLLCAAGNLVFSYFSVTFMPGIIGDVITAWVLYFLLVFTFSVIGYVMYRHADELGHDTVDVTAVETQAPDQIDPIKERIKGLIAENRPAEALAIINEFKQEEGGSKFDALLAQAEDMLVIENRLSPAKKVTQLVQNKQYKTATSMIQSYLDDGHFIKPKNAETISDLVQYAFSNNQFKTVLQLCKNFDQRYPDAHELIIKNYFLVAKIYYHNKKIAQAEKLLNSLITRYSATADTQGIRSYLIGIRKLNQE